MSQQERRKRVNNLKRAILFLSCSLVSSIIAFAQSSNGNANQIWSGLLSGNQRFVTGHLQSHDYPALNQALAQGQQPKVAVLSCSDSRVPPEIVFDQAPGDLFVVRNAGNSADKIALGSLEYAVANLGTTVIVVMGHQKCGAVEAACSRKKMPSPNLETVVEFVAPSCGVAAAGNIDPAIRDHVHRTAEELLKQSTILKQAAEKGTLSIIEAYYQLGSGTVTRLR
jgi:carbonic anhydrase